jgi:hypothetical protein
MESNIDTTSRVGVGTNLDSANANVDMCFSSGSAHDWDYPQVDFIHYLWEEMLDQGLYDVHLSLKHKSTSKNVLDMYGQVHVNLEVNIAIEVCSKPPSKTDFINALGFIQPMRDEPEEGFGGPPREWFEMVANRIAEPCKHPRCGKDTVPALGLVQKCYKAVPKVQELNPCKDQEPYFMTDTYEAEDCCDLDTEKALQGHLSKRYGYSIAKDIMNRELKDATEGTLRHRLQATRETWKLAFIEEMRLLLDIEEMPQEKRQVANNNNNSGTDPSLVKLW